MVLLAPFVPATIAPAKKVVSRVMRIAARTGLGAVRSRPLMYLPEGWMGMSGFYLAEAALRSWLLWSNMQFRVCLWQ